MAQQYQQLLQKLLFFIAIIPETMYNFVSDNIPISNLMLSLSSWSKMGMILFGF